jgi:Pyruvate/2-oxoacid:ferredoxin oxidoreductase delta subunit
MKVLRKIIEIDDDLCDGCGNCIPSCAEGALEIVDGKARMIADFYCDGLGACLGECPTGALSIVEREADDFDEEAVEEHLAKKKAQKPKVMPMVSGGCPSAKLQTFSAKETLSASSPCQTANQPAAFEHSESALSHWPVQIMLVPPNAPFLKNADLLVVADCVPITYPEFHRDFLKGKAVMMGCPKFDDTQHYIEKFSQICKVSGIKSITNVVMEVPCCSALPMIVKKGMELSGVTIPMEEVVISTRGKVLDRRRIRSA